MTWTWAEPFAGAAACALRLVGGKDLVPPCAWMGSKRRYARAILDAMGVPETPPSRVLLADAGPWGWVWPLLLEPADAARVARVLRSWAGEHPRELWQRLAARPPYKRVHERAAQWLWLQARSASGVPIWWDGWRAGTPPATPNAWVKGEGDQEADDKGEDLRWPGHQAQREAWLASDGRGQARPAGARAVGSDLRNVDGRWEKGNEGRAQDATNGQRGQRGPWRFDARPGDAAPDRAAGQAGALGVWRMGEEPKKARRRTRTIAQSHPGRRFDKRPGDVAPDRPAGQALNQRGRPERPEEWTGRTGGMVNPSTIGDRSEAIAAAFLGTHFSMHHGDASEVLAAGEGFDRLPGGPAVGPVFCYLDPPYERCTGYGWDMPRAEVLELARRWADAGAVVAVSEAEPLDLPGWHHLDLTREGGKPEFLTLSISPARLPERQALLAFPEDSP